MSNIVVFALKSVKFILMSGVREINDATNNRRGNIVMKQNGISICISEAEKVLSIIVAFEKFFFNILIFFQGPKSSTKMRQETKSSQETQCEEELCLKVANVNISYDNKSLDNSTTSLVDNDTLKDKKVNIKYYDCKIYSFLIISAPNIWYELRRFAKQVPHRHRQLRLLFRKIKTDLLPVFKFPKFMAVAKMLLQ